MKDAIRPSGKVEVQVIKKDGTVINHSGHNTIHAELKTEMAQSMFSAQGNFGIANSLFDDDTFTTTIPDNESGIIIKDTNDVQYQMATTGTDLSSDTSFTVRGEVRNDSSASITIAEAYLGHDTASENFGVQYSTYDFDVDGSGDQAVADGDQLNITWQITIDDS